MSRKALVTAVMGVAVAASGGVASAALACDVQNATTKAKYTGLQEAVDAATPGDVLKVKGVCDRIAINKDLKLAGVKGAEISGHHTRGSVVTVGMGASVTISGLSIFEGDGQHYGEQPNETALAGGVYNEGKLVLHKVLVAANNLEVEGGVEGHLSGAGIYNVGTLKLAAESRVVNNFASSERGYSAGAGIYNTGKLTVEHTTIEGNIAADDTSLTQGASAGGGIYSSGTVTVKRSTIQNNEAAHRGHGGGIYVEAGTVKLVKSLVTKNKASDAGGGVYVQKLAKFSADIESHVEGNVPDNVFFE
jgi:hypothetical protein